MVVLDAVLCLILELVGKVQNVDDLLFGGNEYRPDGAVELRKEEDNYVVTQIEDGEWMNYTVSIPTDGDYTVYLVYQSKGNSLLSVASDSEVKTEPMNYPAPYNGRKEK